MATSTQEGAGETGDGETAAASGKATVDAGSAVAAGLQDIAQAWVDYAQRMMHRTTEATESLLKCRSFNDMLAVQAELMRGHLQAFLVRHRPSADPPWMNLLILPTLSLRAQRSNLGPPSAAPIEIASSPAAPRNDAM